MPARIHRALACREASARREDALTSRGLDGIFSGAKPEKQPDLPNVPRNQRQKGAQREGNEPKRTQLS